MKTNYKKLSELYKNNIKCAENFGMIYCEDESDWMYRKEIGTRISYQDVSGKVISDKNMLSYIDDLVIPPQWKDVRISSNKKTHILAIGYDDKKRKQYIYHEKWSEARSLINSYTLIVFGECLGDIRTHYKRLLRKDIGSYSHALGTFLFLLDETVIRVGNRYYLDQNGTVGISTLQTKHVTQKNGRIYLEFVGKSGKNHKIHIKNTKLKNILKTLSERKSEFLFSYETEDGKSSVTPEQINNTLREVGSEILSAKDFRTWHASLTVFENFIENIDEEISDKERKKILIESFDEAAEHLGNSRAMIKHSYAHNDMVETVKEKTFLDYYSEVQNVKKKRNLSKVESRFLAFLKVLYDDHKYFE